MYLLTKKKNLLDKIGYTEDEKLSILRIVNMIAASDGKADKGEITFMVQLIEDLHMPISAPIDANNITFDEAAMVVKLMNIEKKTQAFKIFQDTIESDGEIHKRELAMFKRLRNIADKNNLIRY
ncbi:MULTISPECIES: TerB family tellurite resistance protein [Flammeovirga]|uniref:TerB family tellurite resistance protein n=1 Tax=Flammeovirga agarivorans TaxID=2726742 RepID=A0A7X8XWA0_9BACT|nr:MULTISPECIES: TerB family tellurite resistance protein [Flammeovirga]NLR92117.1 TerB family tellurite resistance protein [Flammeovirga agarivorans]